ncbi:MAG TPA: tyrosine-type recombinase/integrase [Candidatus Limnocylindrales bacterium]
MTIMLREDEWDQERLELLLSKDLERTDPLWRCALSVLRQNKTMSGGTACVIRLRRVVHDLKAMGIEPLHATRDDIEDWLASLGHLSPETSGSLLGAARSLYEEAIDRDLIVRNPTRKLTVGRYKPRRVPSLPKATADAVLEALEVEISDGGDPLAAARDRFIFALGFSVGPRSRELLRLSASDISVDTDPPVLSLFGKGRQYELKRVTELAIGAYRVYKRELESFLGRELRADDALLIALDHRSRLLIRSNPSRTLVPMSKAALYVMVRRRLGDAGVGGTKLGPHRLRKTAATLMYKAGVDPDTIRRTLSHDDIKTTFANYIVPEEDLDDAGGDHVQWGEDQA